MTIDEKKKALRKKVKELKSGISPEEKLQLSAGIMEKIENLPEFRSAKVVLAYWSMPDEVQTHAAVGRWMKDKIILLPVVVGADLELRQFTGVENMLSGAAFGILEPQGEPWTDLASIDFIVVPGVAFDRQNNRMGRGKAYYDKLLVSTRAYKAGVCFGFQYFDFVPADERDVKMDIIIRDK